MGREAKFTNSPGNEEKQGKQPDFFWSIQRDRKSKCNGCTGLFVCGLSEYLLGFLPLCCNLTSS